jgi:hypothetical protein
MYVNDTRLVSGLQQNIKEIKACQSKSAGKKHEIMSPLLAHFGSWSSTLQPDQLYWTQ